jgi:TatD DNase family protein
MLISCPTGVHPWYAHLVRGPSRSQTETNEQHYERILVSKNSTEKADLVQHLSTPSHEWLQKLRDNLQKYPTALVGEIGFDRSARLLPVGAEHWHGVRPTEVRCSPDHQLEIVSSQLDLARELDRSVSMHCVQAHGIVLDLLLRKANEWRRKDMKRHFRICLHSYGGSPGILPSLFDIKRPMKVYMSFSVAINGRLGNKLLQLIEKVPDDRLLIESDYNTPKGIDEAMADITRVVAKAKGWTIEQVVRTCRNNWLEFINISSQQEIR